MDSCRAAVVIPTKNALRILPKVLDKVLNQKTSWPFEVTVIDSGSKDGTADYVRSLGGVRLVEIPSADFGHGKTRNLGVALSNAEFVAFLTHDAEPVDEYWLANLVEAAEQDSSIAGVFGRHVAYSSASPFTKHDLERHFDRFLSYPLVVSRYSDPARYDGDKGWRQFLHFYSDNNSLIRKSVWDCHPYPDVEFAEDQIWAKAVIEAGYSKAYAPKAAVYHSHDYSAIEQLRRAYDESRNFSIYFGYELSGNPIKAIRTAARLAVRAFRQTLDNRYGEVRLMDRFRRASQQIALVAGHCLGANHQRLPRFLLPHLSQDYRLYRS
jgi:rhamnosyltransferase